LLAPCPLPSPPLGLTSGQVARAIGVLPDVVRRMSQEEMHLSARMAVRLGRYFATGPELWAELQLRHDLAVAARELTLQDRSEQWRTSELNSLTLQASVKSAAMPAYKTTTRVPIPTRS
jgi:addiction module HigA family antidote